MSRAGLIYATVLAALVVATPFASAAPSDGVPTPSISGAPPNPSNSSSATFTFTDADPTATFQCVLDTQAPAPCQSPMPYSGLADGSHTFTLQAMTSSEQSQTVSYIWVVDTTPPPAPSITSTPGATDSTPTFGFTDNEADVGFQCRLDHHDFADCASPKSYPPQADGSHTFTVQASDKAGNTSSTSYRWTIDTTPPVLTMTQAPPNPSNSSTATFRFSATDASAVSFRCRLDAGAATPCSSPTTFSALAPGAHSFTVGATDAVGNTSAPKTYAWTVVDTTPPGDVSGVTQKVGYGVLRLAWQRPPDPDFAQVKLFVSTARTGPKSRRLKLVYQGTATHYANTHFDNAMYHRYTIVSYDASGNASPGARAVIEPSALLSNPRMGAVVHAPPRLAWARVRGASFYNVQLYRGGEKILSAWPTAPRRGLARHWVYRGHSFRLRRGVYSWFVWPGYGPRSKSHYGRLLGLSSFTVH